MHRGSRALARQSICALFGATLLQGVLGCNTITKLDSLHFDPCSSSFTEVTTTASQGSDGGSDYTDICPDGQVLVGLRAGVNGSVISGISGICGVLEVSETFPYTVAIAPGDVMSNIHGAVMAEETESRICPENTMAIGFEGSTFQYSNQGVVKPIMLRITLHCAPIVIDGPSDAPFLSLGPNWTTTLSLGGAEDQGDAFDPVYCPDNQMARGIYGRSGLLVDAFGLQCAESSLDCPGTHD